MLILGMHPGSIMGFLRCSRHPALVGVGLGVFEWMRNVVTFSGELVMGDERHVAAWCFVVYEASALQLTTVLNGVRGGSR